MLCSGLSSLTEFRSEFTSSVVGDKSISFYSSGSFRLSII